MSKQKLLLADDSVTIQKVVNLTFADEGIEVISVGDGDSAMEKILETSPDLIMVDVNMPGLNGYQICEKLRKSDVFRKTPVILLVGSFEPFDEDEAKRVGADDYMTKPFQSIRQLVQKVNSLLLIDSNSDFIPSDEPKTNIPVIAPQTTQVTETFDDTLRDYTTTSDQSDFGDVTTDDEMIQTSHLSADSEKNSYQFDTENYSENVNYKNDASQFKTQSDDEFSSETATIEPQESKPYVPIMTEPYESATFESESVNQTSEIVVEEEGHQPNSAFDDVNSSSNISLPERASILTLDEQNLLEIAPREEDFILNMESEQNASAEWDLFDTDSKTDAEADSVSSTNFEIVQSADVNSNFQLNAVDEKSLNETDESNAFSSKDDVTNANTEDTVTEAGQEIEELKTVDEKTDSYATENFETNGNINSKEIVTSTEKTISVPTYIASAVVSEVSKENLQINDDLVEVIVNRVMERLSDTIVREIAWEIVPSHTDLIVKKMVQEKLNND